MTASQTICPLRVELRKTVFSSPREAGDLHVLIYDCGAGEQFHTLVHVPAVLREHFVSGHLTAFELHRLKQNDVAMRALSACPEYLVTAVALSTGVVIWEVPPELIAVRTSLNARALALGTAGLVGAGVVSLWALALLGPALFAWLRARVVPRRPPIQWPYLQDSTSAFRKKLPT